MTFSPLLFFSLLSFSLCSEVSNLVTTNFKRKKTSSSASAAAAAIQLTMVSKMMDDGEEKKSKTTTTTKKSVLERLEPKTKTIRKESRNNSPTTFYNNNNNNYNKYNYNRGGRGRGFFDRGFNSRGGSGGGYRDGGRARLKSSLCNQFPAKKDAATGEVIVRCYGCVIIRVTTTGETSLYRENVESKNYAKALNVMNEHLKKIGFSVTSSNENNTTNAEGMDSHIADQEGGGGAPRWNVSGMKKFMLFVEGMTLPPPPSPGPGRGLALLLPTKV